VVDRLIVVVGWLGDGSAVMPVRMPVLVRLHPDFLPGDHGRARAGDLDDDALPRLAPAREAISLGRWRMTEPTNTAVRGAWASGHPRAAAPEVASIRLVT
jgi:hypothetical protein